MGGYVAGFDELRLADADQAGGKGANLGELVAAELPVPPGFVILRSCYEQVIADGPDGAELDRLHAAALAASDDATQVTELCRGMRELVHKATLDGTVRDTILAAYHGLGEQVSVAVRSSAIGEDSATSSFAGMNISRTNVHGDDQLLAAVIDCWASLFTPRVVTYRARRGIHEHPVMAVAVQRTVTARQSGVAFTADPASGRRDRVVIDAARGQGEVVVSGAIEPDTYLFDAEGPTLLETRTGRQDFEIMAGTDGDRRVNLSETDVPVLSQTQAMTVARLALAVQQHHGGKPQDVEWTFDDNRIWLVRARPITMLPETRSNPLPDQFRCAFWCVVWLPRRVRRPGPCASCPRPRRADR